MSYERLLIENRQFRSNGGRLTQNFSENQDKYSFVWYINLDRSLFRFVRDHACDGRTTTYSEHEHEFTFAKNYQGQSCTAFIGVTIGAKIIGGEQPLLPKILSQNDRVGAKFEQ